MLIRCLALVAVLAGAAWLSPLAAYEDDRDSSGSKAKSSIKGVIRDLTKLEGNLEKESQLKKFASWEKKAASIEKKIAKITDKDAEWDIAPYTKALEEILGKAKAACAAYADKKYREGFDKEFDKLKAGIDDEKRLDSPSFFTKGFGKIEKYFAKILKKEPERDVSKEKAELEEFQALVEKTVAAHMQMRIEEAEPDIGTDGAVTPLPGVETAKPMKPDWCGDLEFDGNYRGLHPSQYFSLAGAIDTNSMRAAATAACAQPDFAKRQQWAAAWRQGVINATGLPDADVRKLYALVLDREKADAQVEEVLTKYGMGRNMPRGGLAIGPRETPADKAFKEALAIGVGAKGMNTTRGTGDTYISEYEWWLDRSAHPPSELHRAVFVLKQIGVHVSEDDRRGGATYTDQVTRNLGGWAFASVDASRLDQSKFDGELAALGLNDYGRLNAKIAFHRAKLMARIYSEETKAFPPAIQDLVGKAPARGFTAWEALKKKHARAWGNSQKIEKLYLDGKPAAFAGTFAKTFEAWRGFLRAEVKDATDKEAIKDVAFGGLGYNLASALVVSAAAEKRFHFAKVLYNQMEGSRVSRGPRWAAYWATLEKFGELKAADPNLPLEQRNIARWLDTPSENWTYKAYEQTFNNASGGGGGAIVESVSGGDPSTVTFVTKSWEQKLYDCVETNKIHRITPEGQIVYRQKCTYKGTETRQSTEKPVQVSKILVRGIAAGNLVNAHVAYTEKREAVPIVIWDSPDEKRIVNYCGVDLP